MTSEPMNRAAFDADESEALQAIGWRPAADESDCPDSSLLLAAEDGVLDDAMAERVRQHVASCSICRLLAKDLASVMAEEPADAEIARIKSRIAFGRKPVRHVGPVWLGAGGLLVAAAVAWFFLIPQPAPPPVPDTRLAKATPPPGPSVLVVDRPTIPPGDVDLTVRGEAPARVSVPDQVAAALDAADKGDLSSASKQLETIVRRNTMSRSAGLAFGAVQLRAGQNAEAMATLERARSLRRDPELDDEIDWFLGIALVRTGNRERARLLIDGVCKHGGARSATACAAVLEIDRTSR